MINVIISGCNGKMGSILSETINKCDDMKIVAGIDVNAERKSNFDVYSDPSKIQVNADVIIDFSHPAMFNTVLDYALENSLPIVFATTGLDDSQINKMKESSEKIPIFFSANMSVGVNLLIELVKQAAVKLSDKFDIEILEKHHNRKIDAPSGTALAIADAVNDVLDKKKELIFDRHSIRAKRKKSDLGIQSIRGGTIVGEHSVFFAGNGEIIEIKHTAMSREIFAEGAVTAAKFILGKKPDLYNMNDLLA